MEKNNWGEQNRMKRSLFIGITLYSLTLAVYALADEPAPFPEFTFKRMKVPTSGSSKRITVQIDPTKQRIISVTPKAEPEPDVNPDAPVAPKGPLDWYWTQVSPKLLDANPGRLEQVVNALSNGPKGARVSAPRLQHMQNIAATHGADILIATIGTKVSPALVLAVIGIESAGKVNAESSAGAHGLMQLMPATAERFGVKDRSDPADNIKGGVAYLDWLMGEFDNDPIMVLASYNAGEGAVRRHEGVPPYAETRAYVPKVLAAWAVAKGLCVTQPQLMSDGCVFANMGSANNG